MQLRLYQRSNQKQNSPGRVIFTTRASFFSPLFDTGEYICESELVVDNQGRKGCVATYLVGAPRGWLHVCPLFFTEWSGRWRRRCNYGRSPLSI